jgi:cytoskeletal protein RodZ
MGMAIDTGEPKTPSEPKDKAPHQKKWMLWLLILIILLLLGAAGYLWWQWRLCINEDKALKKDKQQLQTQIEELKKQAAAQAAKPAAKPTVCNDTPTASRKENIKAALDSQNTAAFATYTSNPVKFVIAGSEKGDNETPDQAAMSLDYTHSATGPWNFNLPATTIAHYDAGFYTDYFDSNTYVGKAASGMVAAFDFDCNGKINQIFLAASDDLL